MNNETRDIVLPKSVLLTLIIGFAGILNSSVCNAEPGNSINKAVAIPDTLQVALERKSGKDSSEVLILPNRELPKGLESDKTHSVGSIRVVGENFVHVGADLKNSSHNRRHILFDVASHMAKLREFTKIREGTIRIVEMQIKVLPMEAFPYHGTHVFRITQEKNTNKHSSKVSMKVSSKQRTEGMSFRVLSGITHQPLGGVRVRIADDVVRTEDDGSVVAEVPIDDVHVRLHASEHEMIEVLNARVTKQQIEQHLKTGNDIRVFSDTPRVLGRIFVQKDDERKPAESGMNGVLHVAHTVEKDHELSYVRQIRNGVFVIPAPRGELVRAGQPVQLELCGELAKQYTIESGSRMNYPKEGKRSYRHEVTLLPSDQVEQRRIVVKSTANEEPLRGKVIMSVRDGSRVVWRSTVIMKGEEIVIPRGASMHKGVFWVEAPGFEPRAMTWPLPGDDVVDVDMVPLVRASVRVHDELLQQIHGEGRVVVLKRGDRGGIREYADIVNVEKPVATFDSVPASRMTTCIVDSVGHVVHVGVWDVSESDEYNARLDRLSTVRVELNVPDELERYATSMIIDKNSALRMRVMSGPEDYVLNHTYRVPQKREYILCIMSPLGIKVVRKGLAFERKQDTIEVDVDKEMFEKRGWYDNEVELLESLNDRRNDEKPG